MDGHKMIMQSKEWKDDNFKVFLELFKHIAKQEIDRKVLVERSLPGSSDYRVYMEVMNKQIVPRLEEYASIVYGFTIAFNENPEAYPSYSRKDALDAELVLDEVLGMLSDARIIVTINRQTKG
jgi:hypothetical protein